MLRHLGYNTKYILLDASNFGIPQKRKRVYIVGCKERFGEINLDFNDPVITTVEGCIDKGQELLDTKFTKLLLSYYTPKKLQGKFLKDKRGGKANIHSWDFDYKGKTSKEQKELLNKLFKQRRRKVWAKIIGIDWMDGMPLTTEQIRTFFDVPNLQGLLDDLVEKKYLVLEHPKKKVTTITDGGSYSERVYDETKPKGYNIVTGKLSFPISHILDNKGQAPTIVAMDMNNLGVADGKGIRRLTLREGLRLFGYPEDYSLDFYSHDSKGIRLGYDLLGNSVCVPVIKAVANRLLTQIYIHNHE